jgi:hypothetical protein
MSVETSVEKATSILGVAGSITTLISLAALSLLIAYLLARQWLRQKSSVVKDAIAKSDNDALARLLGGTAVPLDTLTADQKFALATEELRTRSRTRTIVYALIFFSFIALLAFAFALALFSPRRTADAAGEELVEIDPLRALDILRLVPAEGRAEACTKLLSAEQCRQAGPTLLALQYQAPTSEQNQVIDRALSQGGVTASELQELAACGGSFTFRVENERLLCADGTPVPYVGIQTDRRQLTAREAIVFHSTASPENSFVPVATLLAQGRPGIPGPLAHLVISRSGAVAQSAPLDRTAFHVGRSEPWNGMQIRNSNSIGIELINLGSSQQDFTPPQIAAAKGIARALVQAYGIQAIVGHSDVSPRKPDDPGALFPMAAVRKAAGLTME